MNPHGGAPQGILSPQRLPFRHSPARGWNPGSGVAVYNLKSPVYNLFYSFLLVQFGEVLDEMCDFAECGFLVGAVADDGDWLAGLRS